MNRLGAITVMTALLAALAAATTATSAYAQASPPKAGAAPSDAHKEAVLKDVAKLATPDAHHQLLAPLVGRWTTAAKLWMGDAKPETSTGHAEVSWILGGRFVEQHYDSVIWGKPFAGQGLLGYDTREQRFVSTWVDTWSTWVTVAYGSSDAAGKVLTLTARDDDVKSGKTHPVKFVYTIDSHDHFVMRAYVSVEGKETLTMEIEYKRSR